jgi:HEAT repeat protein
MINFLRNFNVEKISFWLGFLAGCLFWLLVRMLAPALTRMQQSMRARSKTSRSERMYASEIRLSNDILRLAQGWHVASPLFALDEILIPPRLLAPPIPPEAEDSAAFVDITDWAIPYTPDWPEMGSLYGAPTLSLAEALGRDANIAVIGEPGVGKSVALAHLACQVIRRAPEAAGLEDFMPLLVHAADLIIPPPEETNPEALLNTLINALSRHAESKTVAIIPKLLPLIFNRKTALLLLDGLDELPPALMDPIVEYLGKLLHAFPGTRIVTAAAPNYLDGLFKLNFFPLAIAIWNAEQRAEFLHRWGGLWDRFIAKSDPAKAETCPSLLLGGWLLNNTANLTPLELTLKVWAAFAGDSLGPLPNHAIEAHIRRLTYHQSPKNRLALERLASQMALSMQPVADLKSVENWVPDMAEQALPQAQPAEEDFAVQAPEHKGKVRLAGAMPNLIESGLVVNRLNDRVSIAHPALAGYLASLELGPSRVGEQIAAQPEWSGRSMVLHYLVIEDSQPAYLNALLQDEATDPLLRGLLSAGRWLREAPEDLPWISTVMRHLAACLQKENLPLGLRVRALSAMVSSGNPGVAVLLRQMLQSPRSDLRQMAALGMGYLGDPKAVSELIHILEEQRPGMMHAAALALARIGDKASLELIAETLLHGEETLRRAAAEALAINVEEGHPTLEEASALDDPLVRRSAVYGLARIKQPWSIMILEKIRSEEKQWVVQDVAIQSLDAMERPNPRIPTPLPDLTMTPWLISFAGERGMGVAPGKPAYELLFRALREGSDEQRLAALHYLTCKADENGLLPVYQTYYSNRGELQESALNAIWHIAAAGVFLPPPIQYGLK